MPSRTASRNKALRKPQWYRMTQFFDGPAKKIADVGDEEIVLSGFVEPDKDLAVVLVPPSVTHEQGKALEMTLKAQFGVSVLVLSNNIQLVKLKPIPEVLAKELMERGGADVVHYSKEEAAEEQGEP